MSRIVVVILMCLFSAYANSAVVKSSNTLLLKQWLSGEHLSTNDKIQGRDVQLALQILPIWQDRIDGEWLYMESSIINSPHKPFRQRILRWWIHPMIASVYTVIQSLGLQTLLALIMIH